MPRDARLHEDGESSEKPQASSPEIRNQSPAPKRSPRNRRGKKVRRQQLLRNKDRRTSRASHELTPSPARYMLEKHINAGRACSEQTNYTVNIHIFHAVITLCVCCIIVNVFALIGQIRERKHDDPFPRKDSGTRS